jgi:hypothetical protein
VVTEQLDHAIVFRAVDGAFRSARALAPLALHRIDLCLYRRGEDAQQQGGNMTMGMAQRFASRQAKSSKGGTHD